MKFISFRETLIEHQLMPGIRLDRRDTKMINKPFLPLREFIIGIEVDTYICCFNVHSIILFEAVEKLKITCLRLLYHLNSRYKEVLPNRCTYKKNRCKWIGGYLPAAVATCKQGVIMRLQHLDSSHGLHSGGSSNSVSWCQLLIPVTLQISHNWLA